MSVQTTASARYSDLTASMQVDPEARHTAGAASESFLQAFPIASARCATHPAAQEVEWVPDREQATVPELVAVLCRRCEGRQECLLWALTEDEPGYWAATTRTDRHELERRGEQSVEAADRLRAALRDDSAGALHPAGEGSYWWYRRRGCRCGECRAANSAQRAGERAKARSKAA